MVDISVTMRRVSGMIVQQLERGTAPWQRNWRAGGPFMPMNPVSGNPYRGMNAISLAAEAIDRGYTDNRWLTPQQANNVGATVRAGELGTVVQYWQFSFSDGGKMVKLEKPRTFHCVVFNAQQIDGLADLPRDLTPMDQSSERIRSIVRGSRAGIAYDANGGPARYDRKRDTILLKRLGEHDNVGEQQISVIHQLAHWTAPRLGRDIDHPVGSIGTAREELRTNLASLMLGDRLLIGWNPGDHAMYAEPCVMMMQGDTTEILRAALSAEAITQHVLGL